MRTTSKLLHFLLAACQREYLHSDRVHVGVDDGRFRDAKVLLSGEGRWRGKCVAGLNKSNRLRLLAKLARAL